MSQLTILSRIQLASGPLVKTDGKILGVPANYSRPANWHGQFIHWIHLWTLTLRLIQIHTNKSTYRVKTKTMELFILKFIGNFCLSDLQVQKTVSNNHNIELH